jgi:1-acyl-sn-glycerol-3-phosphate acyltransferase
MWHALAGWLFKVWGWKITGRYPYEIPKLVQAVAPHTSNWDFPVGILVREVGRIDSKFVAKHTLFRGPFDRLLRGIGGVPVDRTRKGNFVEQVVGEFRQRERFHLTIAPEGTRTKVDRFRTGFYHIARSAGVPILLTRFDWARKEVHFGEIFQPTGNEKRDLEYIWNYFKGVQGRNPEKGIL